MNICDSNLNWILNWIIFQPNSTQKWIIKAYRWPLLWIEWQPCQLPSDLWQRFHSPFIMKIILIGAMRLMHQRHLHKEERKQTPIKHKNNRSTPLFQQKLVTFSSCAAFWLIWSFSTIQKTCNIWFRPSTAFTSICPKMLAQSFFWPCNLQPEWALDDTHPV